MGYYDDWVELAKAQDTKEKRDVFFKDYYDREKAVYEAVLSQPGEPITGTFAALSDRFGMDRPAFAAFLDGINASLKKGYDVKNVKGNSKIVLDADFEKLYYSMLEARADWLCTLEQWDGVLSPDERAEIERRWKRSRIAVSKKVGRNQQCPCGSGKKYKKCCGV